MATNLASYVPVEDLCGQNVVQLQSTVLREMLNITTTTYLASWLPHTDFYTGQKHTISHVVQVSTLHQSTSHNCIHNFAVDETKQHLFSPVAVHLVWGVCASCKTGAEEGEHLTFVHKQ